MFLLLGNQSLVMAADSCDHATPAAAADATGHAGHDGMHSAPQDEQVPSDQGRHCDDTDMTRSCGTCVAVVREATLVLSVMSDIPDGQAAAPRGLTSSPSNAPEPPPPRA